MDIRKFISSRKHLVWFVKDPNNLSNEAIIEAVLNYGNWEDVQELIKILGMKNVADTFSKQTSNKRTNYRPEVSNYFKLYFAKHV